MPPIIPCHNSNQLNPCIASCVVCAINAKEPVPEAPEHVRLKFGLED